MVNIKVIEKDKISSDPSCKDGNAWFTTVPYIFLPYHNDFGRFCSFLSIILIISVRFPAVKNAEITFENI